LRFDAKSTGDFTLDYAIGRFNPFHRSCPQEPDQAAILTFGESINRRLRRQDIHGSSRNFWSQQLRLRVGGVVPPLSFALALSSDLVSRTRQYFVPDAAALDLRAANQQPFVKFEDDANFEE
jgi:hypothetical protein